MINKETGEWRAISPQEFYEEMKAISIAYDRDPVQLHKKMDELMRQTLNQLGYFDGICVFMRAERWYGEEAIWGLHPIT